MSGGVRLEQVRFTWPGTGFAVSVDDLAVAAGEQLAVVGPSGSGKSTLLALMAGEQVADTGSVTVAGARLGALSEAARRRHRLGAIGRMFQDHPLIPYLSALDNTLLPYRLGGPRLDGAARHRARTLLTDLGLDHALDRRPEGLSQGERQRVALARALVTEPAVVLADEPTSGLDPERTRAVVALLQRQVAERGATLILVTHDAEVRAAFDRVMDLGEGT